MSFNNANPKNIRQAEKAAALVEQNRIAYVRQIMGTMAGRAWMHDLLDRCCMFHSPLTLGYPDGTAFNIGKQDIGRQVFGDVTNACPNEYSLMMTEASTKEAANDRRNSESTLDSRPGTAEGPSGNFTEPASAYTASAEGFVTDASTDASTETGTEGTSTH